jgi:hypothetical protein
MVDEPDIVEAQRLLDEIDRTLEDRVEIVVSVIEPDGRVSERLYQGSFQRHDDDKR